MRRLTVPTLLVTLALVAAACGSSEDATDTTDTTAAAGEDPTPVSFTVAVVEPDIASVPVLAAVESLADAGHDVDWVEVAEPELAIDGLARGEFEISGETISAALIAIQAGAPITIVGDVVGNAWVLYGRGDVTECGDLDGTRIGIFSEGAVATAMVRQWIAENCPDIETDYLVIGGSDVRYQALVAGEVDATALDVGEGLLLANEDGQYNLLANFSTDLSDLRPSAIYANADFVDENPEAVQLYLEALLEQHAQINADPAYLVELAIEYLGGEQADWELVASAYAENGLFDAAAINEDNLAYTIAFFEGAGVIEPGLTPADVSNLGPLRAAAESVGS
jgi:NitT/TauT family transport system substrate-binding protein